MNSGTNLENYQKNKRVGFAEILKQPQYEKYGLGVTLIYLMRHKKRYCLEYCHVYFCVDNQKYCGLFVICIFVIFCKIVILLQVLLHNAKLSKVK